MGKPYRSYLPEQDLLLPPSLRDWLPDSHLVYFVSDVVDQLDLSAIEKVYEKEWRGQPPYHPRLMVKLLVYGYCLGVRSSRKIAQRLVEDVPFRVLAAGNQPDFRTISDFRKIHLEALEQLFQQVLRLALEAGALKLGRVALDGTKMKANASKHKAMSWGRMKQAERQIAAEVKQMLAEAEQADAAEDALHGPDKSGQELPEELQRRKTRLEKIRQAQKALQQRAREKAAAQDQAPEEVRKAKPREKDQYNFSDPESRIMKGGDGFLQGYNAQAAVEGVCQLIVGQTVTQAANDKEQLTAAAASGRAAGGAAARGSVGRQRVLFGAESRIFGIGGRAGEADRGLHRHQERPARAASAAREARTLAAGSDAGGADEAQVADAGRSEGLRPTQVDRRTGVWPDQTGARDARISLPRAAESARRMGADMPDAQHFEDAQALLWIARRKCGWKSWQNPLKGARNRWQAVFARPAQFRLPEPCLCRTSKSPARNST